MSISFQIENSTSIGNCITDARDATHTHIFFFVILDANMFRV